MSLIASELRQLTEEQLNVSLREAQDELQAKLQLKHSKQVQPEEIRDARKDIARIKMVQYENKLKALVEKYSHTSSKTGIKFFKKHIPKELRQKKTKALRMALTKRQKNMKSRQQRQIAAKYKKVVYSYSE